MVPTEPRDTSWLQGIYSLQKIHDGRWKTSCCVRIRTVEARASRNDVTSSFYEECWKPSTKFIWIPSEKDVLRRSICILKVCLKDLHNVYLNAFYEGCFRKSVFIKTVFVLFSFLFCNLFNRFYFKVCLKAFHIVYFSAFKEGCCWKACYKVCLKASHKVYLNTFYEGCFQKVC